VYVAFDPDHQINDLYLAEADGRNPIALVPHGTFASVDDPFFPPDGASIVFSATGPGLSESRSPLDRLLGIQVALANGSPSDWWQVSVMGGPPRRLTAVFQSGLDGAFSPDGSHIAFVGSDGLFVMEPDGGGLDQLLSITGTGAMQWFP
jgi:Tol biopolymer transport system component